MWLSSTCCPTCCGVCGGKTKMIWQCTPRPQIRRKKVNQLNAKLNMEKKCSKLLGQAFTPQCPTAKVIFHIKELPLWGCGGVRWPYYGRLTTLRPLKTASNDHNVLGGCCGIWSLCHPLFSPCVLPCSHIRQYCGGHHRWGSTGCFFTGPP